MESIKTPHQKPVTWYPKILPKSCKTAVTRYAGAANGTSWKIRRIFLNLKSQFESNHPFKVPKPPPNKLVSAKTFKVPITSSPPAMPNEKLPLIMYSIPSNRKLEIGMIIMSATINEVI